MSVAQRFGGAASPRAMDAWRTRDILVAAVIGVVFGVVFFAWYGVWSSFAFLPVPLQDWSYGMWFVPAVLAPLIVRKPGAALFAELVAAGVSMLVGSPWSADTLVSGLVQGLAAEAVFAAGRYRIWTPRVAIGAAAAAAVAAWLHDWWLYYGDFAIEVQVIRLIVMAASAAVFAGLGSLALERALRRAGVLQGFPA